MVISSCYINEIRWIEKGGCVIVAAVKMGWLRVIRGIKGDSWSFAWFRQVLDVFIVVMRTVMDIGWRTVDKVWRVHAKIIFGVLFRQPILTLPAQQFLPASSHHTTASNPIHIIKFLQPGKPLFFQPRTINHFLNLIANKGQLFNHELIFDSKQFFLFWNEVKIET